MPHKPAIGVIVALAMLIGNESKAQVSTILSGGYASCAQLEEKNAFNVEQPNMQWLLGYLSGAAAMSMSFDLAAGQSSSRLSDKLAQYDYDDWVTMAHARCIARPQQKLYEVANAIVSELNEP